MATALKLIYTLDTSSKTIINVLLDNLNSTIVADSNVCSLDGQIQRMHHSSL